MYKLSLILATFFAVARLWHIFPEGLAEDSFKAFAHLFVGGLFTAAFTHNYYYRMFEGTKQTLNFAIEAYGNAQQYWVIALILSFIELLAFMLEKFPLTSL